MEGFLFVLRELLDWGRGLDLVFAEGCVSVYMCVYVCMYVYMGLDTYIYIHTYTHPHVYVCFF